MAWPLADRVTPLRWRKGATSAGSRAIPEEVPLALTYNGSAYAVMMVTPADLADFALGFSISENVVDSASEIESLDIIDVEGGIEARMWLKPAAAARNTSRRRSILGPTGCGLCGVESIAQALKAVPPAANNAASVSGEELVAAMAELEKLQALNAETRAVHAAGLWLRGRGVLVREDAGRHNALDKVIGAAAGAGLPAAEGVVLLTSRLSVELVQKTAKLGASIISAVSAPTALAVRVAESAGITLVAVMRGEEFEIFTVPERITAEASSDEA
jgi:FdhD protein